VSSTTAHSGPDVFECAYIRAEGNQSVVTVHCPTSPVGRYVTLIRDEAAPQFYLMNVCEVEVFGTQGNKIQSLNQQHIKNLKEYFIIQQILK